MGPTNIALVKLFEADLQLREAQARLDQATRNVRIQERRVADLQERLTLAQSKLMEQQAHAGTLDVDIKARDERIERLRTQQQTAKNNKEYQAFLVEINTEKVDRGKVEDELLRVLEVVETIKKEVTDLSALLQSEQAKLVTMRGEIEGKTQQLRADIEALAPARNQAAEAVPGHVRDAFDRLSDRFDGEAMASVGKPYPRREEYICNACNMSLVVDVYNRLHTRDEIVFCPSCHRMLYIPSDLPVEEAVRKPKERKERKPRKSAQREVAAAVTRQTTAADVLRSMQQEDEARQEASSETNIAPAADAASPTADAGTQENEPAGEAQAPNQGGGDAIQG
jgi:uncharacterized protein